MLERLNAHRKWANQRILEWCYAPQEPDAYCVKMMSHILLGERAWLSRIQGEPIRRDVWESLTGVEAAALLESNELAWKNVLDSNLNRVLQYTRFTGEKGESSVSDIAIHVCTHGMYHRGQIAAQDARIGLKCPSTDFIVFSRMGPAS